MIWVAISLYILGAMLAYRHGEDNPLIPPFMLWSVSLTWPIWVVYNVVMDYLQWRQDRRAK